MSIAIHPKNIFSLSKSFSLTFFCKIDKWCLDNSISSQVTTPITVQELSSALISALEFNTVSPVSAPNDATFDILLAELVNWKLAVKSLVILIVWRLMTLKDGWLKISFLISFWCDEAPFIFLRSFFSYIRILRWTYLYLSWAVWKKLN